MHRVPIVLLTKGFDTRRLIHNFLILPMLNIITQIFINYLKLGYTSKKLNIHMSLKSITLTFKTHLTIVIT